MIYNIKTIAHMKNVILIICIFYSFSAYSQKSKIAFSVSAGLSSQTSSNYIESINDPLPTITPNNPPKFFEPPVNEKFVFGGSISLNYEHQIKRNFSLFSGLAFTQSGFQIIEERLLFQSQYKPGEGYVYPQVETYGAVSYNYNYYQLGIPLGVNYFIPFKKMNFFVGAGAVVNYLTAVNSTTTLHNFEDDVEIEEKKDISQYNKFSGAALLNFGAEWTLKNSFSLRVFSNSQYTFTNFAHKDKEYTINPYLSSIGISILKGI